MAEARPNGELEPIRVDNLRSPSDHAYVRIRAAILWRPLMKPGKAVGRAAPGFSAVALI
jgi:hypothetical protein